MPVTYFAAFDLDVKFPLHHHFEPNYLEGGGSPLLGPTARQHHFLKGWKKKPLKGGLQHWMAHNCSPLYNDWLAVGCWQGDGLAASQEFRLFWGCDVCCCCLLLFWPCSEFPLSFPLPLFPVMMRFAEAHSGEPRVWKSWREIRGNESVWRQDILWRRGARQTSGRKKLKEWGRLATWKYLLSFFYQRMTDQINK